MPEQTAEDFIAQSLAKYKTSTGTATNSLTPKTDEAFALSGQGVSNVPISTLPTSAYSSASRQYSPDTAAEKQAQYELQTERLNPSAPFDPNQEVGGFTRLALAFRRGKEREVKYLQNKYGADNVSMDARGDLIVKVLDEDTQKPKFIPVDLQKMSGNDFVDMLGSVPELAGSIIALRKGKNLRGGTFKDLAISALGAEGAGALKDIGIESLDYGAARVGQIARERATQVPIDIGVGGAMTLFGKGIGKVITPFGDKPGPIQFEGEAARNYFRDKYGIDIPMTPGEATGNTFLMRAEAMLKKLPGGSKTYSDIRKAQDAAFQRVQDIALGRAPGEALPSAEKVGQEAIDALKSRVGPITAEETAAREAAIAQGDKTIRDIVGSLTKPAPELYKSKVGEMIRGRVTQMRDEFEGTASSLYEKAMSLPGGRDKILVPESLASNAKELIKKLPSKDVVKEVPTGMVDEFGKEIVRNVKGKEVLKEFIPDKVLGKLNELASLGKQKFSLEELKQMRTEVTNDIKQGEAIPGVQTHFLGKIRDILTNAMDEAATSAPTPELKTAFEAANKFYKENVGKFHRPGIAGILKDAEVPGHVGDSEIVGRLTSGTEKASDLFRDMKDFLGAGSTEFEALKRSLADEMMAKASISGGRLIDAKAFQKGLDNLYANNREIAEEVFGKAPKALQEVTETMQLAQKGDTLDYEKLKGLLARSPEDYRSAFMQAIRAQKEAQKIYSNKILDAINKGSLSKETIEPERFVDEFLDKASLKDTRQVLAALHDQPEVMQGIRQKTVQKIMQSAARSPSKTDPISLGTDEMRLPSAESLAKAIGSSENADKLKTILGEETFENLVQFAKAMKPSEAAEQSFSAAGGLSAGMQVSNMLRGGDLAYLANFLKYKIAATLLTTPGIKQWVGNRAMNEERTAALVNTLIASSPFINSLIQDLGEEGAAAAMEQIKGSIDRSVRQGDKPQKMSAEDFITRKLGATTNKTIPIP